MVGNEGTAVGLQKVIYNKYMNKWIKLFIFNFVIKFEISVIYL